jgi:hypothetical protein
MGIASTFVFLDAIFRPKPTLLFIIVSFFQSLRFRPAASIFCWFQGRCPFSDGHLGYPLPI